MEVIYYMIDLFSSLARQIVEKCNTKQKNRLREQSQRRFSLCAILSQVCIFLYERRI
ncbi:hypothetical protein KL86CLO1_10542 [uncultured Eubacteriales bacterium]|uniref:Uncharacterized protein n=1 Tax=uncultured Eubacteriales bacterium TaxID=172733 RepID=A0A212J5B8_9FIRM|nr:hypothetical protein KL86CLO1_10542 [uncultured Eubacteriales bacterium]